MQRTINIPGVNLHRQTHPAAPQSRLSPNRQLIVTLTTPPKTQNTCHPKGLLCMWRCFFYRVILSEVVRVPCERRSRGTCSCFCRTQPGTTTPAFTLSKYNPPRTPGSSTTIPPKRTNHGPLFLSHGTRHHRSHQSQNLLRLPLRLEDHRHRHGRRHDLLHLQTRRRPRRRHDATPHARRPLRSGSPTSSSTTSKPPPKRPSPSEPPSSRTPPKSPTWAGSASSPTPPAPSSASGRTKK